MTRRSADFESLAPLSLAAVFVVFARHLQYPRPKSSTPEALLCRRQRGRANHEM